MNLQCKHPGCEYPHKSAGYCAPHYVRWRKDRDMDAPIKRRKNPNGTWKHSRTRCKAPGCDRVVRALGYCRPHYSRYKDGVDVDSGVRSYSNFVNGSNMVQCKHPGCELRARKYRKGYCYGHYNRMKRGEDMDKPIRKHFKQKSPDPTYLTDITVPKAQDCTVEGCERVGFKKLGGLCIEHELKKYGIA